MNPKVIKTIGFLFIIIFILYFFIVFPYLCVKLLGYYENIGFNIFFSYFLIIIFIACNIIIPAGFFCELGDLLDDSIKKNNSPNN